MKMADDSLMILQNNCVPINRNGAEANKADSVEGCDSQKTIINKTQCDVLRNSGSEKSTTEDAVGDYLAGDSDKNEILLNNADDLEECIYKVQSLEHNDDEYQTGIGDDKYFQRYGMCRFMVKNLKKRSIKCLNKMQIMEDVREGCNAQPSSPGHAEQRSDGGKLQENGYEELNADKENDEKSIKEEDKKSENESEMVEIDKEEPLSEETYCNTHSPNAETNKRKSDIDEFPIKRLRSDIHENFVSRDKIVNEFIEMADCNNLEQIHMFSEQLLAEIKTLNELAKEKEREWNNIIHLKKLKEELLLRMQRKKQVMLINDKSDYVELLNESQNENTEDCFRNTPQSILKANLTCPQKASLKIPNISINGEKTKSRNSLPKPQLSSLDLNGLDYRQGKQRPTLDVQSIIADYRQRHPETVPRRGRRIRGTRLDGKMNILNFSSMALGSGSQVRQNAQDVSNELGFLLNTINMNKQEGMKLSNSDSVSSNAQDAVSFKDMLLQFAKLSQSERNELIQNAIKPPPPYPEVTVHPVPTTTAAPTNSLLHGILTKSPNKQNSKTSFSPTLARLLTAPERAANASQTSPMSTIPSNIHPSNVSISEILSTNKARNEITITPVEAQFESTSSKGRLTVEEEAEDSADRLVIDESNENMERRTNVSIADTSSDNGDEVPQCQGCNQKPAQFVCAGCGNQWYCSRDCQVSAWDEHSEVCSG